MFLRKVGPTVIVKFLATKKQKEVVAGRFIITAVGLTVLTMTAGIACVVADSAKMTRS